jgi:hypothetical protein
MPLYEITADWLKKLEETTFESAGIGERTDLQRLLGQQVAVISPDTLIISEEFCDWEDSRRRVDLLGIAKDASIVVIELKRTEDGGHMELQAIRYAAMVSALTFDKAVEVYASYLSRTGSGEDARMKLLEFLQWDSPEEGEFGEAVQIVLASAEFSKELTTSVIWLNSQGLDIRCVRLRPYRRDSATFLDVQQVIPLPEAAEYQVQLRQKEQQARQDRVERHGLRDRYLKSLLVRAKGRTPLHANVTANGEGGWVGVSAGYSGMAFNYVTMQKEGRSELYIARASEEANKRIFDALHARKAVIEAAFGSALLWERLDGRKACRISITTSRGGYRDDEQSWPQSQDEMIEWMIRLERVLSPHLQEVANA